MITKVKLKEIVLTFTNAVDVINPILKHHHRRVAIIAYHLGTAFGLSSESMTDLIIASALHDIGALTVADAKALAKLDVHDPRPHELLGSLMLSSFMPFKKISRILKYHHVNFAENPITALSKVPIEAYILHLADRVEILLNANELALNQKERILSQLLPLKGAVFAPEVMDAFLEMCEKEIFWFEIDDLSLKTIFDRVPFERKSFNLDNELLESLVYTLSHVIDFKSRFTVAHSTRVAYVAEQLSKEMGLSDETCYEVKIAAYLHDLGKIAVPSEILAKEGALTKEEYNIIKIHPYYTRQIISNIKGLEKLALWAGAHHEKRDGSGYPKKIRGNALGSEMKIIIYADLFSALAENRPYRKALSHDEVMNKIKTEYAPIIGGHVFEVLQRHSEDLYAEILKIQEEILAVYNRQNQ